MPKIAELIQADYDEKWFADSSIRTVSTDVMIKIKDGLSPFKAEVSSYITAGFSVDDRYKEEIDMLSRLSEKNLAGVITTNYDNFIENHFNGYTVYVGQKELIFSAIQGVAEIFNQTCSLRKCQIIINK